MLRLVLPTAILLSASALLAQDELFDFIPPGGRGLIEAMATQGLNDTQLGAALAVAQDSETWGALLASGNSGLPGDTDLDDYQRQTLADYLAYVGPQDSAAALPQDGRDMALARCQSCHIITVVITQDRTREAWLGSMGKPSHIEIPLSEAERGQLADYLVVNAGIPIDLVPPALRAGGASY
ncbi:MAG: hypothetical protein Q8P60_14945 [Pseudorhodobacter sp.]|nr:hypothetical protein [Pseudorhodobacter sp.]